MWAAQGRRTAVPSSSQAPHHVEPVRYVGWLKSTTGRTSIVPNRADGIFAAT
jgi:hypothetical protein